MSPFQGEHCSGLGRIHHGGRPPPLCSSTASPTSLPPVVVTGYGCLKEQIWREGWATCLFSCFTGPCVQPLPSHPCVRSSSIHPSFHLSIHTPINPSMYPFNQPSTHKPFFPSIQPSIHPHIHPLRGGQHWAGAQDPPSLCPPNALWEVPGT